MLDDSHGGALLVGVAVSAAASNAAGVANVDQVEAAGQVSPLDPTFAAFRDQTRFWVQRVAVPLIMVVGLFGNLITVIIMTRRRMRSTTNMYLAALALVDMLYLVLTFLLGLSHYPNMAARRYHLYWRLRPFLMMLTDACSNTSVWLTVTFTIERFIAVRYPIKGKLWCTEARAKRLIGAVFSFAILFALPVPFEWQVTERQVSRPSAAVLRNTSASEEEAALQQQHEQQHQQAIEEPVTVMSLEYSDFGSNETYKTIYYWSTAVIFYFIPLLSLTFFNGFLIHSVHRSRRERTKMTTNAGRPPALVDRSQSQSATCASLRSPTTNITMAATTTTPEANGERAINHSLPAAGPQVDGDRAERSLPIRSNGGRLVERHEASVGAAPSIPITSEKDSAAAAAAAAAGSANLRTSTAPAASQRRHNCKQVHYANPHHQSPPNRQHNDGLLVWEPSQWQRQQQQSRHQLNVSKKVHTNCDNNNAGVRVEPASDNRADWQVDSPTRCDDSDDRHDRPDHDHDHDHDGADNNCHQHRSAGRWRRVGGESELTGDVSAPDCATDGAARLEASPSPQTTTQSVNMSEPFAADSRPVGAKLATGEPPLGRPQPVVLVHDHNHDHDHDHHQDFDYEESANHRELVQSAGHGQPITRLDISGDKMDKRTTWTLWASNRAPGCQSDEPRPRLAGQDNESRKHQPQVGQSTQPAHNAAPASSQERRITIMLISVVILFLFCQIPSAAMLLYTSVHEPVPNTNEHALLLAFGNIFNFLMAVNAAGNFILYSFLSKKYRRTFVILFCSCLRRAHKRPHGAAQQGRPKSLAVSATSSSSTVAQQLQAQQHSVGVAEDGPLAKRWTSVRFARASGAPGRPDLTTGESKFARESLSQPDSQSGGPQLNELRAPAASRPNQELDRSLAIPLNRRRDTLV